MDEIIENHTISDQKLRNAPVWAESIFAGAQKTEPVLVSSESSGENREVKAAFRTASNFIKNRAKTESEIRSKLESCGFSAGSIDSVMTDLKKLHWVDDKVFTDLWIDSRKTFRPRSKRMLAFELRRKGISERNISESLDQYPEDQAADNCAVRYGKKYQNLEKDQFHSKVLNYLRAYGFPFNIAQDAAEHAWNNLHETGDSLSN